MKINEKLDKQIDRYLLNKMNAEERKRFEEKLAGDPELQELVFFKRDMFIALKVLSKTELQNELAEKERKLLSTQEQKAINRKKLYYLLFALIGIIILTILIYTYFKS